MTRRRRVDERADIHLLTEAQAVDEPSVYPPGRPACAGGVRRATSLPFPSRLMRTEARRSSSVYGGNCRVSRPLDGEAARKRPDRSAMCLPIPYRSLVNDAQE